jgi:hypothetical protein
MRWSRIVVLVALLVGSTCAAAAAIAAERPDPAPPAGPVTPYVAPPFAHACRVHSYGEGEAPDPAHSPDDPLCVEYAKRDITVDDGGAVAFLLAEPARFAVAAPKCQYWQRDHWSIQVSRGDTAIIRWDGSYWFDKGTGQAAGRLRHLTVGGRHVSARQAARLVRPASPELAAYLREYSRGGDGAAYGGSAAFDPRCAS